MRVKIVRAKSTLVLELDNGDELKFTESAVPTNFGCRFESDSIEEQIFDKFKYDGINDVSDVFMTNENGFKLEENISTWLEEKNEEN